MKNKLKNNLLIIYFLKFLKKIRIKFNIWEVKER